MKEAAGRVRATRIFLDSNVLFSGLYSPNGPPGVILKYFVEGGVSVVVSQQVLEEVIRTLGKKLPEAMPALREFLLSAPIEVTSDPCPGDIARWIELLQEGDANIIAAAISSEPDFFVTGDSHFLENPRVKEGSGLKICSPAGLLKSLGIDSTT